jgi:hypothetical protein
VNYILLYVLKNLISLIAQGYLDSVVNPVVALYLNNALSCIVLGSPMLGVGSSF